MINLSPLACKDPPKPKTSFTSLVLSSLSINVLGLALPLVVLQVYDRIIANQSIGTLWVLMASLLIVVFLEVTLKFSRSYLLNMSGVQYEHAIFCNSVRNVLKIGLSLNVPPGEQLQRINHITKIREMLSGQLIVALMDLPFLAVYFGMIAYIGGMTVVVPLAVIGGFVVLVAGTSLALKKVVARHDENDEVRLSFVAEMLTGIHTIKSLGAEAFFQRKYESIQASQSINDYKLSKINSMMVDSGHLFNQLMIILIVVSAAPLVIEKKMTLGALIACIILAGRISSFMQKLLRFWSKYLDCRLSVTKINQAFLHEKFQNNDIEKPAKPYDIEIKNICVKNPNENMVFRQQNVIHIPFGSFVCLQGSGGSGKTYLLEMLAGIKDYRDGSISIGGVDLKHISMKERPSLIGYIPMKGVIFKGTIKENLSSFGVSLDSEVVNIIHLLNLEQEISSLPNGFDTYLEASNSDPIPPGLKQKISIGRALVRKPKILLLDEFSRSLDQSGYNQLYGLLAKIKGKATIIVITNDKNLIALSDHLLLIKDNVLTIANNSLDYYDSNDPMYKDFNN